MKKVMHRLLGRLDLAVQMLCILLLGVVIMVVQYFRNPGFFRGETIQIGNDRDTQSIEVLKD